MLIHTSHFYFQRDIISEQIINEDNLLRHVVVVDNLIQIYTRQRRIFS